MYQILVFPEALEILKGRGNCCFDGKENFRRLVSEHQVIQLTEYRWTSSVLGDLELLLQYSHSLVDTS
jgi:hypothetical protein